MRILRDYSSEPDAAIDPFASRTYTGYDFIGHERALVVRPFRVLTPARTRGRRAIRSYFEPTWCQ